MLQRIIIVSLLALASFGAHAGVDMGAFEKLNAKIDCIIANGGLQSRHAKDVCVDKIEVVKTTTSIDTRKRDNSGLYHWKNVSGAPAKAAYESFSKGAHAEIFIGKKVHDDLIAMGLTADDMSKVFHPIFNQTQDNLGLLTEKGAADHHKKWDEMFRNGTRYPDFIQKGDVLKFLSFRKGIIQNVVADFEGNLPTFVFPLENGKELLWIPACQNFAIREPVKNPPVVPGINKFPPPEMPPFSIQQLPPEQKKYLMDFDAFGFYGEDYGKHSQVSFYGGEGAIYPIIIDSGDSKDEFGIGGFINGCNGSNQGFHFDCNQWGVGPAYKHFSNNGWDMSLKPTFGQLIENGLSSDKRYESRREMDLVGLGGGINFYQRQMRGEKWFPETQVFGRFGLPIGMRVHHSYDGQNISDTKDLKKFDALINFGVRQILYDGEWIRPHIEAGYFGELPTGQSLRAQIGFSDHWKILFCSIGPNFGLSQGGVSLIWSCGVDVSNVARKIVGKVRQDQFRSTLKNYDEETGGFTLMDDDVSQNRFQATVKTYDNETSGLASVGDTITVRSTGYLSTQTIATPLSLQPFLSREAVSETIE